MESSERNFVQSDIEGLRECLLRNYAYVAAEITVDADITDPDRFLFARDNFIIETYALAFARDFCCIEPINRKTECYTEEGTSQDEVEEFMDGDILKAAPGELERCGSSP
ncbi:hypothetical protein MRX96_020803 [Rhipicephalus microplus]